jgi:hypothetical protein
MFQVFWDRQGGYREIQKDFGRQRDALNFANRTLYFKKLGTFEQLLTY